MDRRVFTKTCIICLSGSVIAPLFTGCKSTTYYTKGNLESNGISVFKSDFTYVNNNQSSIRQYLIVRNDAMEFPIYLYRFSDNEYSALLMQCSHQGNELQASGDYLHCSAHGSEFNNKGVVAQGPAEKNLRTFKVSTDGDKIFIDLRA
ncbi:MAG: Rieske Fe-S protein [Marivirga sp.]|nr:Rieske Fe-S protein [Marivirga sp.]